MKPKTPFSTLADHGEASAIAEDQRLVAHNEHVEASATALGLQQRHRSVEIDPADIAADEPAVASLSRAENLLNEWIIQSILSLLISVHLISFSAVGLKGAENG